jgi:hypothetical protein
VLGGGSVYDNKVWQDLIKDVDINGDGEVIEIFIPRFSLMNLGS